METVETARIKFTPAMVRETAERVKRITDGMFALGVTGTHPEYGPSYTDSRDQLTWYGAKGAREACAYYTAAAGRYLYLMDVTPADDDGEFLLAVQVAYTRNGTTAADREDFDRWETRGADRAQELINAHQGDA
jgi:hypothetical protein